MKSQKLSKKWICSVKHLKLRDLLTDACWERIQSLTNLSLCIDVLNVGPLSNQCYHTNHVLAFFYSAQPEFRSRPPKTKVV